MPDGCGFVKQDAFLTCNTFRKYLIKGTISTSLGACRNQLAETKYKKELASHIFFKRQQSRGLALMRISTSKNDVTRFLIATSSAGLERQCAGRTRKERTAAPASSHLVSTP